MSDGGAGYLDGDRFVRVVDVDRSVWFIGEDAQRDIWISLLNQLVRVRRDGTTESRRFADSAHRRSPWPLPPMPRMAASGSGLRMVAWSISAMAAWDDAIRRVTAEKP